MDSTAERYAKEPALHLQPWQCVTIPAMARHRTRALGRTVNLCFENLGAETVFVDPP
jgi:mannose-6-phosphate isomerase-like protein (cupin superfamily)